LAGARLVVGNSSCGIRECSFLGVPAVNVGQRQRIRERAQNIVDVKYGADEILSALVYQDDMLRYTPSYLYGNGLAARAMVRYLLRIDYTLKSHITYPLQAKFRSEHFGEGRFRLQNKHKRASYKSGDQHGTEVSRHGNTQEEDTGAEPKPL